jgi:hypothetical protein
MIVARHEMPGKVVSKSPSRRVRYDLVGHGVLLLWTLDKAHGHASHRSLRDGLCLSISQAFHAWLPSSLPYGTKNRFPFVATRARLQEGTVAI